MHADAKAGTDPLGPLLDSPPPAYDAGQVAALLARHWGLAGDLHPLTSERDLNHRLTAPEGRFVVKIANAAEPRALTRFQNRALRHAAAADATLPVPRVVAALTELDVSTRVVVSLAPGLIPQPGAVYDVLDLASVPDGVNLETLLELPVGVEWDTSEFTSHGRLKVVGELPPLTVTVSEDQVAETGGAAVLSAMASGAGPFLVRWFKDDVLLPSIRGPQLLISEAKPEDTGTYRVEVSNGSQTVSATTTLLVTRLPVITSQPQGRVVLSGQPVTLSVEAAGPGVLVYDWRRNGQSLGAPNSPILTLPAVTLASAGNYTVRVSNVNGFVDSDEAELVVNEAPVILNGPQRRAADEGEVVSFSVIASGSAPLAYQWQFNEEDLEGETGATLTRVAGPSTYGRYRVVVRNAVGATNSATALLSPTRAGVARQVPEWAFSGMLPTAQAAVRYAFRPRVRADDPEQEMFRSAEVFEARGLPPGLVMDAVTGEIRGVPTLARATPYLVELRARNAFGTAVVVAPLTVSGMPTGFAGIYAATLERSALLAANPGDTNGALGGRVDVTVTSTGQASGRLTVGTRVFPFRGGLVIEPGLLCSAALRMEVMQRGVRLFELAATLNADLGEITGTVSEGAVVAGFTGWRNPWGREARADLLAGYHTCRLDIRPEPADSDVLPIGTGFWTFTVSATTGRMTLAGRLCDGTPCTLATFAGAGGQVPVFRTLYAATARGSLLGSLALAAAPPAPAAAVTATGILTWSRPANPVGGNRLYRAGFPGVVELAVTGGRYAAPAPNARVLGLTDGNDAVVVDLTGGDLATALPTSPALVGKVDTRNRVTFDPSPEVNTRKLMLTLMPRTGLFKGRFVLSEPNPLTPQRNVVRTVAFEGVLVNGEGAGFFVMPLLPMVTGETPTTTPLVGGRVLVQPVMD